MRNELNKGYKLIFPGKKEGYIIKDVLGRGASCLVYLAEVIEGNNVRYSIIKEFNPVKLDLVRDASGALILPKEKSEQYSILLERFKLGYEKQQQIRIINDLTNTTSNIQGIYNANNTEYIEMTYFNGETYSVDFEKNLYDFFRRMKALTQVISNYHNAGFLHLDIKPDNVYVLPETPEMVMLFDFDSVIEKAAVIGSSPLSYTKDWAAIEQIDLKRRKEICEATDLFAVGEMIFYYFFGRHSDISERRSFSKYAFDYNSSQFDGVNPLIIDHLSELLHKTICNIVKNRYQTAQELINKLDILISLSNPNVPFLKTNVSLATGFFVGRDAEITLLHDRIQDANVLFVSGIGGIGKSELVKHYAKKHANDYYAIIFAPFVSDFFTLITDDVALPICNFKRFPEEKAEEYYARKLRKLKELCDENVLIIIDNFDNAEELDKFLELNCKMLFTTRCDFSDAYVQIDVSALKERKHIGDIFNNFYTKPLSAEDKEIVEKIIDVVEGHTMTVELLAKQMMAGRVSPKQMLERLTDGGIADSGKEKIRISKDDGLKTGNAYSHIQALFDLSELNDDEIYILANLCLIPHTGISAKLFCEWCEIDNYDIVNSLVAEGWVRLDKERDYISLHPLISAILTEKFSTDVMCSNTLKNMYQCTKHFHENTFEEQKELIHIFIYSLEYVYKNNFYFEEASIFLRKCSLKLRSAYMFQGGEIHCCFQPVFDLEKMLKYVKRSVNICLKVFGKEHISTYRAYRALASLYKSSWKIEEARDVCLECLKISKVLYGVKSEYFMTSLIDFGNILKLKKQYGVAEKIYKRVKYLSKFDYEKMYFKCLLMLGDLYGLMGINEKSTEMLCEYIDLANRKNIEIPASIFQQLCVNYRKSNQVHDAIINGKKAVEIAKNKGRGNLAIIYSSLGYAYLEYGDVLKAEKYLECALKLRETLYGNEHIKTARSYFRLGCVYDKTSELNVALEYFLKAEEIQRKTLGNDDPETIESCKKIDECRKTIYKKLE